MISRTTSNGELYYDYRDTFTINGKRLVKVSGPAASEEGVYRCEIESDFSRYELRNSSSGGIWYVYDKSGTITILGETTDSRVYRPDNMNKTYIWNFSRSYDLNGNFMSAVYDTSEYATNHILYVKEIQYTGNMNTGLSARQFVRFTYKDRDDAYISKSAGFIMRMTRMLDAIVVGWNDPDKLIGTERELWRYTMEYQESAESERPLLTSVDSSKYTTKPEFIYQKAVHTLAWQMIPNQWATDGEIDPKTTKYFEGDFNGDGISDMVIFNPATGDWKAAEGTLTGGYLFKTYGNKFKGYDGPSRIQFFKGNVTGDYNGDGRSDIAFYLPETNEFVVAESDGRVLQFRSYGKLPSAMGDIFACEWFTGDYDGNGLSDIMLYDEKSGNWTLMCNKGGYFEFRIVSTHFKNLFRGDYSPNTNLDSPSTFDYSPNGLGKDRVQFFSGDYNGDGRTDIAVYDARSGKWYVGENYRASSGFAITWRLYRTFTAPEQSLFSNERFSGDFNGDGFSDFLLYNRDTGEWVIGETGDGTITFRTYCKIPSQIRNNDITRWLQGDFNGDGKTDIGFYSKTDNNFWIGEGSKSGFRFRIYNNLSYGPDPARVLATPLPLDEVEITQGRTICANATTNFAVDYSYDGNYHTGKGERSFLGFFANSNALSMLIYNKDMKKYFQKVSGSDPVEITSLYGTDLEVMTVLNRDRAECFRGSTDSVLTYAKSGGSGAEKHTFNLIDTSGKTTLADFSQSTLPFDLKKTLFAVDSFTGGSASLLALDDTTGTFSLVSNTTVTKLSFDSGSAISNDYFTGLASRREQIRIIHGKWGSTASLVLVDLSGANPVWYRAAVAGSRISFVALSGTPSVASSSFDAFDYHVTGDGIIYSVPNANGIVIHKVTLSATAVTDVIATVSNVVFKDEYDALGQAVVYKDGVAKSVEIGAGGAVTLRDMTMTSLAFDRPDLMSKVYPFQWIQGDYNGDGKTDIGIFHLTEPKWYFAVTTGTVPDMISTVKNGIGGSYEFEYSNSTKFDNTGSDGIPHLPMNYKVCTKLTVDDGCGRRTWSQYEYAHGYAFSGFIDGKKETDYFGFSEFTVRDPLGGRTINLYNTVPYDDFRKNRALAGAIKESRFIGSD
ncbi:MAG TPA: FG-GAP-like repeat-containing protein, partial [Spirochaetota bacterium]